MGLTNKLGLLAQSVQQDTSLNIGIGGAANASFKLQVTGATNLTGALTGAAATFSGNLLVGPTTSGFDSVSQIASSSTGNIISALTLQNTSLTETAGTGVNLNFGGRLNWLGRISTQFVGTTGGGDASMTFSTPSGGTLAARLTITSNGQVGIGTTTPSFYSGYNTLTIDGTSGGEIDLKQNGTLRADMFANSSGFYVESISAIPLIIGTAGAEKMRITSGGNVGIGTTSPASKLHVSNGNTIFDLGGFGNIPSFQFLQSGDNPSLRLYRPTGSGTLSYVYQ